MTDRNRSMPGSTSDYWALKRMLEDAEAIYFEEHNHDMRSIIVGTAQFSFNGDWGIEEVVVRSIHPETGEADPRSKDKKSKS